MMKTQYPTLIQFEKWMKEYKRLQGLEDKANEGIKGLYDDFNGCFLGYHNDLIGDLLKALMDDKADWISWYIWEKEWGTKKALKCYDKHHVLLPSTTVKDLYNLINEI